MSVGTARDGTARRERRGNRSLRFAGRAARKVAISTLGSVVLALGVAMLVLPGPGLLVVIAGLGILSTEYHWPRRLRQRLRDRARELGARARERRRARRGR